VFENKGEELLRACISSECMVSPKNMASLQKSSCALCFIELLFPILYHVCFPEHFAMNVQPFPFNICLIILLFGIKL
jgi:hypothetical protein